MDEISHVAEQNVEDTAVRGWAGEGSKYHAVERPGAHFMGWGLHPQVSEGT